MDFGNKDEQKHAPSTVTIANNIDISKRFMK